MKVQELPVKDWLAHLRRNPIPEIMDDACLDALRSVEAQYGEEISHGAGLEVRLGNEARYVDYIMNIDADTLPFGMRSITRNSCGSRGRAGLSSRAFLRTRTRKSGRRKIIGTSCCRLFSGKRGRRGSGALLTACGRRCQKGRLLSRLER